MSTMYTIEHQAEEYEKGAFLLLHGMESHSEWFEPLFPFLRRAGYAVVAYDRPGWGKSEGMRGHMESYAGVLETISQMAAETRKKHGRVHLTGMSWGGMAALYAALRRPWLFDSIALLAPGIAAKTDLPFMAKFNATVKVLAKRLTASVPTSFQPEHFTADPDRQSLIRTDPDLVRQVSTGFCFETLKMRRFIGQAVGKRRLPPTTCLLAGDDVILDNEKVEQICRRAGATIQTFAGCRHTLVFEQPEGVAEALVRQAEQAESTQPDSSAVVAGAGAVGGLTATLLSFGGTQTGVLVKEKYLESMRTNGILLTAGQGSRTTGSQTTFAARPGALPNDPDLLIIAVKSFDTDTLLDELSGKVSPRTVIASLQNGLGNEAKIAAAFPENTLIAGSICASVEMPFPGSVIWPDDRGGIAGALYKGDEERAKTAWRTILSRTGMECAWVDGERAAERLKWSKLMLNIGFNALNSLTGMTSAQIMADQVYGKLVISALREGFSCMDRLGLHPVDIPGYPLSKLRLLVMTPGPVARKAMAWQASRSTEAAFSMRQDVLKKRHNTEIGEINGIIVKTAAEFGMEAPTNAWLVEHVRKRG